jgi:hypothetical protein
MKKQIYYLKNEPVTVKDDYEIIVWIWKWNTHNVLHERWTTAFVELISTNLNLN